MYEMIKAHMTQNIPFAGHAFVTIDEIGPGHATAHIEDVNEVKNHINTIHAGALFTLAETASGAAMAGTLGERLMQLRPVAKDASIAYKKIAKGTIVATGRASLSPEEAKSTLDEAGKVVFVVDVDLTDDSGDIVAQVSVNWHVSPMR